MSLANNVYYRLYSALKNLSPFKEGDKYFGAFKSIAGFGYNIILYYIVALKIAQKKSSSGMAFSF
jgi:hypothetical protein